MQNLFPRKLSLRLEKNQNFVLQLLHTPILGSKQTMAYHKSLLTDDVDPGSVAYGPKVIYNDMA